MKKNNSTQTLRHLTKTFLIDVVRYFVLPSIVITGIVFFVSVVVSTALNIQQWNAVSALSLDLLTATLFSSLIFASMISSKALAAILEFLSTNEKMSTFAKNYLPKLKPISIRTRILLKPYLGWLAISFIFLSIGFFVMFFVEQTSYSKSINLILGVSFYVGLFFALWSYRLAYTEKEKTLFLFDDISCNVGNCLKNKSAPKPSPESFEEAFRSYRKTLPAYYAMKDINKRAAQFRLVLDRGSREDIEKLQRYLQALSYSVKNDDSASFDEHFGEITDLLEEVQKDKEEIIELRTVSRKKSVASVIVPVVYKVLPALIVVVVILVLYKVFGIWPNVPSI